MLRLRSSRKSLYFVSVGIGVVRTTETSFNSSQAWFLASTRLSIVSSLSRMLFLRDWWSMNRFSATFDVLSISSNGFVRLPAWNLFLKNLGYRSGIPFGSTFCSYLRFMKISRRTSTLFSSLIPLISARL
ncbi:hypothetical protein OGAPHI_003297 [Ogataea philodendri]|uniref:Uncharacterized protein n=1 Tax=Ogataea philodendri TaxID=1378263 RepID=A0A9P8P6R5_9ASCO|nr:uncharacterized protein OGAPHI_003297 [Ogataea philodendri]KAH3666848.1 hypothetical protein OGAPHI_003297 [Ogataea philodendri]